MRGGASARHGSHGALDLDLLDLCVKHNVEKVVAASSASVYGMAEEFPTTEGQHPYNNRTLYGAAKAFNEGLLRTFNDMYGLDYVAFRYFNVYGAGMDIHGRYTEVLIRWMERIEAGQAPIIFGDGKQTMDFVHVEDVALANILGAKSEICDEVFNVATGVETTLSELAQSLTKSWAEKVLIRFSLPSVPSTQSRVVLPRLARRRNCSGSVLAFHRKRACADLLTGGELNGRRPARQYSQRQLHLDSYRRAVLEAPEGEAAYQAVLSGWVSQGRRSPHSKGNSLLTLAHPMLCRLDLHDRASLGADCSGCRNGR